VPLQSIAFFAEPLQREYGWSHTQVSLGASVFSFAVIPFAPFAGAIQDWLGTRKVAIVGCILCIVAISSLALTTGAHGMWIGQWTFLAFAELPLKATVWVGAVSAVFLMGRGLAVGAALCGTALAQTLVPLVTYYLIEHFGWRLAYAILGSSWGGVVLILVVLLFQERRVSGAAPALTRGPVDHDALPGLTLHEALRCVTLYRVALALMVTAATSVAVLTNKVAILGELGISRGDAAAMAATAGFAGVFGKLFTGWLYDHAKGSWINAQAFAAAAGGFLIYMAAPRPELLIVAQILFGYAGGATLQSAMYLMAQYGGLKNFGKIFGVKTSILAIGMGGGPLLAGMIKDMTGSFYPLFVVGVAGNVLAMLLVVGLGPFPDWTARKNAARGNDERHADEPAVIPA
jgi:MFS family permease